MRRMHWTMMLVACLWLAMPVLGSQGHADSPVVQDDDEDIDPDPEDPDLLAAGDTQVYQEYAERMRSGEMVSPLGSEIFGENVNLFDGATTFNNTDIDIPGNSALPVRLQRRFDVKRVPRAVVTEFGGSAIGISTYPTFQECFPVATSGDIPLFPA